MARTPLTDRIERALAEVAGLYVAVEESDGAIVLAGRVESPQAYTAAEDIVAQLAPGVRIDNTLEIEAHVPASLAELAASEPTVLELPHSGAEIRDEGADIAPDFTDQRLETTGIEDFAEPYPRDTKTVDLLDETQDVVFAPTDPVITTASGNAAVLGGFAPTAVDEQEVAASAEDRSYGDEALAEAIQRALREDAATAALSIEVIVRNGIAHLRGTVEGLEDADNAEAVAARVPGVRDVREELRVRSV